MTNKDDSAYPCTPNFDGLHRLDEQGLTKREYFAVTLASSAMSMADIDSFSVQGASEIAVRFADALIAELNKLNK